MPEVRVQTDSSATKSGEDDSWIRVDDAVLDYDEVDANGEEL